MERRLASNTYYVQQCPHSSFPLKRGNIFDIEDLGNPNGAGIKCFRHGWKFDLFTGNGDRGSHKLNLWDIELRDPPTSENGEVPTNSDKEVWVRRPTQSQSEK
jgi:nitrite reductase/ring-hydroxylating ferredoxin subunit